MAGVKSTVTHAPEPVPITAARCLLRRRGRTLRRSRTSPAKPPAGFGAMAQSFIKDLQGGY